MQGLFCMRPEISEAAGGRAPASFGFSFADLTGGIRGAAGRRRPLLLPQGAARDLGPPLQGLLQRARPLGESPGEVWRHDRLHRVQPDHQGVGDRAVLRRP